MGMGRRPATEKLEMNSEPESERRAQSAGRKPRAATDWHHDPGLPLLKHH